MTHFVNDILLSIEAHVLSISRHRPVVLNVPVQRNAHGMLPINKMKRLNDF